MISQHPEVEARIVEELQSLDLLATPQRPRVRQLQHADLSRLTYLSCAIKVRASERLAQGLCLGVEAKVSGNMSWLAYLSFAIKV